MSNANRILQGQQITIQLITTVNTDNEPIYLYLMLNAHKWKKLEKRLRRESVDFSKEGKILAYGFGHTPDPATRAAMQKVVDAFSGI
jgi:hypothetical protein